MGHTSTRRTLYLRRRFWDYRLATNLMQYVINPRDPDEIVYASFCSYGDDNPGCGLFYFNASRQQTWRIGSPNHSFATDDPNTWSPNGRFAMLDINIGQALYVVDFATGNSTKAELPPNTESPPWRTVLLEGWSPRGDAVAFVVANQWQAPPVDMPSDYDLFEIDLSTSRIRYVASITPRRWMENEFQWEQDGQSFRLVAGSSAGGATIFRKQPGQVLSFR